MRHVMLSTPLHWTFFPVLASDSYESGDSLGTLFLFQRISVILQRFNAVSIDKSFLDADEEPDL